MRSEISSFLGLTAPPRVDGMEVRATVERDGYAEKLVSYRAADGEEIAALLFEPRAARGLPVLALHQHNSEWAIGKSEIAGLVGDPLQAFGPALAREGVMVLAPDAIGFESRRARAGADAWAVPPSLTKSTPEDWLQYYNLAMHRLVMGELLMTKVLRDCQAAVSVLAERAGVHEVGLVGHSYGGNVALFAAALDERIAFACTSGAACSYRHKLAHGVGLENALIIPGFARRFDVDDLLRAVAPRKMFVVSSNDDPYSADADDLVARARPAFEAVGAGAHLRNLRVPGPHPLDAERFNAIVGWLSSESSARLG